MEEYNKEKIIETILEYNRKLSSFEVPDYQKPSISSTIQPDWCALCLWKNICTRTNRGLTGGCKNMITKLEYLKRWWGE